MSDRPYVERIDQFLFRNPRFTVHLLFEPRGFRCNLYLGDALRAQGYSLHTMSRAVQRCFQNFKRNPSGIGHSVPTGRTETARATENTNQQGERP